jgi:hypothetical protein
MTGIYINIDLKIDKIIMVYGGTAIKVCICSAGTLDEMAF